MTSPVALLTGNMQQKMSGGETKVFFDDARRKIMLRGVFDAYYSDVLEGQVTFDTNRTWTGRAALLAQLYPTSRIICCVREIGWIIDSIERMLNKNALQFSQMFDLKPGSSVYERVETLMNSERGQIGQAWSTLREAWFGDFAKRLIVIPYDTLVRDPRTTLQHLYDELGETYFAHDFHNVVYDAPEKPLRMRIARSVSLPIFLLSM